MLIISRYHQIPFTYNSNEIQKNYFKKFSIKTNFLLKKFTLLTF